MKPKGLSGHRFARHGAVAILLGAFAMLTGCSDSYGPSTTPPPPPPINPREIDATPAATFTPSTLTVSTGDAVTFVFGTLEHSVFFDPQTGAPADIPGNNRGVSITRVFPTAGTFRYTCHIHPSMTGRVVVQ